MSVKAVHKIARRAKRFCCLRKPLELGQLLETPAHKLALLAHQPPYYFFTRPKKDGSLRYIEAPAHRLKQVQQQLNRYLQPLYYLWKTPAAYGFVMAPKHDPAPRNILTNAKAHRGNAHMINIDLEDFFHHVKDDMLIQLLQQRPFSFSRDLSSLISGLATRNGRLPMGSPISPVLSNFATIPLDHELLHWAGRNNITYTRFVDDMSFSASSRITPHMVGEIRSILNSHRFYANEEKICVYGKDDVKQVTGLVVAKDSVQLPDGFLSGLRQDIDRYGDVLEARNIMHPSGPVKWLEEYDRHITGKLNFVGMIHGWQSAEFKELSSKYIKAHEIEEQVNEARSWLDFPFSYGF